MPKFAILITVLLNLLSSKLHAQTFHWAKGMGNINQWSTENYVAVSTDKMANIYTAGHYEQNFDADPNLGVTMLPYSTNRAGFIQKFDPNGNLIWAKVVLAPFENMAQNAQGDLFIIGRYSGTVDFDPGAGTYNMTTQYGNSFVLKLDSAGNFIWVKHFESTFLNYNRAMSIALDHSNNIIITGYFQGQNDFNPGNGVNNFTSTNNSRDIFIVKLNHLGEYMWARQFGSTLDDEGWSVAVDTNNEILSTGKFRGTVNFGLGLNVTAVNDRDIYISKLDVNGNSIWIKSLQGGVDEWVYNIACNSLNDVYVCGSFLGTMDVNPGASVFNLSGGAVWSDGFLVKLNSSGDFSWAKKIGGIEADAIQSLTTDSVNNLIATGFFYGQVNFDTTNTNYTLYSSNFRNIFVAKYTNAGICSWAADLGSNSNQEANDVHLDGYGSLIVTGLTYGTADFNPDTTSVFNITSNGGYDICLCKLQTNCGLTTYSTPFACDSLFLNGYTFHTDTFFTETYTAVNSCDSHFVRNITIRNSHLDTVYIANCDSILFGNQYVTSSGIYIGTFTSSYGCDSIVVLHATVYPSYAYQVNIISCDSFSFNNNIYTNSGIYTHYFNTITNCDSVIHLNVSLFPSTMDTLFYTACDSLTLNGNTYYVSDTILQTYSSQNGCDSSTVLNINIQQSSQTNTTLSSCDSIVFNGQVYSTSGNYTQIYQNSLGCDSIVNLQLTINQSKDTLLNYQTCDSITLNGISYSSSGLYSQNYLSSTGCDSSLHLNIVVHQIDTTVVQNAAMLTASESNAAYQWLQCNPYNLLNGANAQSYIATIDGDYAVIISKNGCIDTSSCHEVKLVGVNNNIKLNNIKAYPNPVTNELHIEFNYPLTTSCVLKIFNSDGSILSSFKLTPEYLQKNKMYTIPVAHLASGWYIIKIITDKGTEVVTFFKL